jgi:hypothetical protein
MFGKKSKMSANDRFVTQMGRAQGNLKASKPFGATSEGVSRGPAGKKGKETPDPYKPRTLKVGKNSGFSD